MVTFNELRLSDDKQTLIVDCQVEDLNVYDGIYINTIDLEYYKNRQVSGYPSGKAVSLYAYSVGQQEESHIRICFDVSDLPESFGTTTFEAGLFYIIVQCDGPSETMAALEALACGFDRTIDTGIVLDWKMLYNVGIQYVAKLSTSCYSECLDETGIESFSILWNAIKIAAGVCDFTMLERLWEKFVRIAVGAGVSFAAGCKCRG